MKFKIRYADQIVGFFSIFAILALVVLIFAAGSKQHWFEKKNYYYTTFDSGSGLNVGMDLTYKGFSIGKIKSVNLEGARVRVDYYVLGEYSSYVRENSLVQLATSPIGLGSSFILFPGNGEELIESGSEIFRIDSPDGQRIIDAHLTQIEKQTDSIGVLMNTVSDLLMHIDNLIAQVDTALSGRADTSRLTPVQSMMLSLDEILKGINQLLNSDDGAVSKLLGPELSDNLKETLSNVAKISSDFTGVSANADKLVANAAPQIDSALGQLNTVLVQVQDVLTGLKNNPLLKGGIPDHSQSDSSTTQLRSTDF